MSLRTMKDAVKIRAKMEDNGIAISPAFDELLNLVAGGADLFDDLTSNQFYQFNELTRWMEGETEYLIVGC